MTDFIGEKDTSLDDEIVTQENLPKIIKAFMQKNAEGIMLAMVDATEVEAYDLVARGVLHHFGEEFGKVALKVSLENFTDHVNNSCGKIEIQTVRYAKSVTAIINRESKKNG